MAAAGQRAAGHLSQQQHTWCLVPATWQHSTRGAWCRLPCSTAVTDVLQHRRLEQGALTCWQVQALVRP